MATTPRSAYLTALKKARAARAAEKEREWIDTAEMRSGSGTRRSTVSEILQSKWPFDSSSDSYSHSSSVSPEQSEVELGQERAHGRARVYAAFDMQDKEKKPAAEKARNVQNERSSDGVKEEAKDEDEKSEEKKSEREKSEEESKQAKKIKKAKKSMKQREADKFLRQLVVELTVAALKPKKEKRGGGKEKRLRQLLLLAAEGGRDKKRLGQQLLAAITPRKKMGGKEERRLRQLLLSMLSLRKKKGGK
ncbi:3d3eed1e-9b7a-4777-913e-1b1c9b9b4180 [Thermothielavioides terrestris]|uniref:3d3eed1e-9b7a-4777-913e-1b1c9b9b4180 n=1 Tax=Thermothielavioides terrestris TaxID=2587410 RepID=A0A3S4C889_9PEZI|nr:3d3eed1e-9b7a-4777-913e-1b1c9b9b4180 [Thermothielavioides terrestris]